MMNLDVLNEVEYYHDLMMNWLMKIEMESSYHDVDDIFLFYSLNYIETIHVQLNLMQKIQPLTWW